MDLVLGVLVGLTVAIVVAVVVLRLVRRPAERAAHRPPPTPGYARGTLTVVLDVTVTDPESPVLARLVREVGARTLATEPNVESVIVVAPDGTRLGEVQRHTEVAPPPAIPADLSEPRRSRPRTPDPTGRHPASPPPTSSRTEGGEVEIPEDRPFADRLDLPDRVRHAVTDPTNPVDVIRAIVTAAGRPAVVDRDVVLVGDDAIVVLGEDRSWAITPEQLTHAFLRFQESGARSGVVICLGFVRPDEVHRRELLAPMLRHTGPEAIQRMADAVALGADPMRFAAGAPTGSSR